MRRRGRPALTRGGREEGRRYCAAGAGWCDLAPPLRGLRGLDTFAVSVVFPSTAM
jgi:hypothetical protein